MHLVVPEWKAILSVVLQNSKNNDKYNKNVYNNIVVEKGPNPGFQSKGSTSFVESAIL